MGLTPFEARLQRPVDELQFRSPCWFPEREREVAAWSKRSAGDLYECIFEGIRLQKGFDLI